MDVIDYVISVVGIVITLYIQLLYYAKLSNKRLVIGSFKRIFLLIIVVLLTMINTLFNLSFSRLIISFVLVFIVYYLIFKESFIECLIKSVISFLIMFIFEVILSFIVMPFFMNIYEFKNASVSRFIFSTLNCLLVYFTITRRKIINLIELIIKKTNNTVFKAFVLLFLLIIVFLISHKYALSTYGFDLAFINLCLIVCFVILFTVIIYNVYKFYIVKHELEVILNFISSYEKLIDENRMKLHEIHNELLLLKSFDNYKEVKKMLNDLVKKYSKNGKSFKNIHKLPSGLKGVLYFKVYEMQNLNINVEMFLPNNFSNFDKIIAKNYNDITKVISILLDNAKEASSESVNKQVIIDFSVLEKNKVIICIENTYLKAPDFNKIYNRGYSIKGKFRGYGLFILKSLIDNNKNLTLNQFIREDLFVSKLIIQID